MPEPVQGPGAQRGAVLDGLQDAQEMRHRLDERVPRGRVGAVEPVGAGVPDEVALTVTSAGRRDRAAPVTRHLGRLRGVPDGTAEQLIDE